MENSALTGKSYNTGYALSGSFIKRFAHLGAIQALLEHDIKPDIILEVSAGVLTGVFYADGNEPYRVLDYFSGHKLQDLTRLVIPKAGLLALGEFIGFLESNLKAQKLEDLKFPLIITATDLDYRRGMHFHKESIIGRVTVSCYMSVLFTPVRIGDTHYMDGGPLMNLPVSTIRNECEKVVAIDASPLTVEEHKMSIVSIAIHSYHFMFRANTFPERDNCDLLIEPYNLEGYSNIELEKAREILKQSYNTTSEVLGQPVEEKGKVWR